VKRFKNILVVFGNAVGDDDTLAQATILAKRNKARLTVVEVIDDLNLPFNAIAEREKLLHRLTASFRQDGVTLDTVVLRGTSFLEIIRHVLREKNDLVMMSAEGEAGFKGLFFGSTSFHLMRKCPCSVWVTKPGAQNVYARVMAAVGPISDNVSENELNVKIMGIATSIAHLNNSELHIAQAWEVTGSDGDTLRSETTEKIRSRIYHKHELTYREPLEGFLGRYKLDDINHQVHLLQGPADSILPQLAETTGIDLIVMGTISRAGIPGFFIGNIAESILRKVSCAVLTVKPESFVSPVVLEQHLKVS